MQFLSTSRISVYALSILPCIFQISISSHVERRDSLLSSLPLGDSALVVLPLGDSITFGTDSTDGNGYRLNLENLLEPANNLQYIGSVQAGSMADNFNEGHPGFTITQIQAEAAQDFAQEPNVVLLMAGTNDVLQNLSVSDAPSRLGDLIDFLTSNLNNSAILVATLTPLFDAADEAERVTYNAAIPGLIETRVQAGKRVMMVDMGNVTTAGISTSDGIHPNDAGYQKMAEAWYDGIITASAKGLINGTTVNGTLGNFTALANSTITASKTPSASTSSTASSSTATAKSFAVNLLQPSPMFSALTTLILGFIAILGF